MSDFDVKLNDNNTRSKEQGDISKEWIGAGAVEKSPCGPDYHSSTTKKLSCEDNGDYTREEKNNNDCSTTPNKSHIESYVKEDQSESNNTSNNNNNNDNTKKSSFLSAATFLSGPTTRTTTTSPPVGKTKKEPSVNGIAPQDGVASAFASSSSSPKRVIVEELSRAPPPSPPDTRRNNNSNNTKISTGSSSNRTNINIISSRHRKEAGIPVGIAVAWQRLVTSAPTSPSPTTTQKNSVCKSGNSNNSATSMFPGNNCGATTTTTTTTTTTSPVTNSSIIKSPPPSPCHKPWSQGLKGGVSKEDSAFSSPAPSPTLPKRPASSSSYSSCGTPPGRDKSSGGSTKDKVQDKSRAASVNSSGLSERLTPSKGSPSLLGEQQYPYGLSASQYADWTAAGTLAVPHLSPTYNSAAAAAYMHQQHQQQLNALQQQQQSYHHLQQLHNYPHHHHNSHYGALHPYVYGGSPPSSATMLGPGSPYPPSSPSPTMSSGVTSSGAVDSFQKYEQYLQQQAVAAAEIQRYHHHIQQQQQQQQHHHLSQHHLHQLASPTSSSPHHQDYDIIHRTPIPSPRINIPSPSPTTLHGASSVATLTPATSLWSMDLLHHNSSTTLSPKSLTSTPSPVTVQQQPQDDLFRSSSSSSSSSASCYTSSVNMAGAAVSTSAFTQLTPVRRSGTPTILYSSTPTTNNNGMVGNSNSPTLGSGGECNRRPLLSPLSSPPSQGREGSVWKDVKISPVPKIKVKKCDVMSSNNGVTEELANTSPTPVNHPNINITTNHNVGGIDVARMEEEAVRDEKFPNSSSNSSSSSSASSSPSPLLPVGSDTKKKHDFRRMESLIEKRDEVSVPLLVKPDPDQHHESEQMDPPDSIKVPNETCANNSKSISSADPCAMVNGNPPKDFVVLENGIYNNDKDNYVCNNNNNNEPTIKLECQSPCDSESSDVVSNRNSCSKKVPEQTAKFQSGKDSTAGVGTNSDTKTGGKDRSLLPVVKVEPGVNVMKPFVVDGNVVTSTSSDNHLVNNNTSHTGSRATITHLESEGMKLEKVHQVSVKTEPVTPSLGIIAPGKPEDVTPSKSNEGGMPKSRVGQSEHMTKNKNKSVAAVPRPNNKKTGDSKQDKKLMKEKVVKKEKGVIGFPVKKMKKERVKKEKATMKKEKAIVKMKPRKLKEASPPKSVGSKNNSKLQCEKDVIGVIKASGASVKKEKPGKKEPVKLGGGSIAKSEGMKKESLEMPSQNGITGSTGANFINTMNAPLRGSAAAVGVKFHPESDLKMTPKCDNDIISGGGGGMNNNKIKYNVESTKPCVGNFNSSGINTGNANCNNINPAPPSGVHGAGGDTIMVSSGVSSSSHDNEKQRQLAAEEFSTLEKTGQTRVILQQQQQIIGNRNYHVLNVPLPPPSLTHPPTALPPSSSSTSSVSSCIPTPTRETSVGSPTTALGSERKLIGSNNNNSVPIKEDPLQTDASLLSSRLHHHNFRPIEEENNSLNLLATVAQEFGNEIGLTPHRRSSFTFDTYEFKEDSPVKELRVDPFSQPIHFQQQAHPPLQSQQQVPPCPQQQQPTAAQKPPLQQQLLAQIQQHQYPNEPQVLPHPSPPKQYSSIQQNKAGTPSLSQDKGRIGAGGASTGVPVSTPSQTPSVQPPRQLAAERLPVTFLLGNQHHHHPVPASVSTPAVNVAYSSYSGSLARPSPTPAKTAATTATNINSKTCASASPIVLKIPQIKPMATSQEKGKGKKSESKPPTPKDSGSTPGSSKKDRKDLLLGRKVCDNDEETGTSTPGKKSSKRKKSGEERKEDESAVKRRKSDVGAGRKNVGQSNSNKKIKIYGVGGESSSSGEDKVAGKKGAGKVTGGENRMNSKKKVDNNNYTTKKDHHARSSTAESALKHHQQSLDTTPATSHPLYHLSRGLNVVPVKLLTPTTRRSTTDAIVMKKGTGNNTSNHMNNVNEQSNNISNPENLNSSSKIKTQRYSIEGSAAVAWSQSKWQTHPSTMSSSSPSHHVGGDPKSSSTSHPHHKSSSNTSKFPSTSPQHKNHHSQQYHLPTPSGLNNQSEEGDKRQRMSLLSGQSPEAVVSKRKYTKRSKSDREENDKKSKKSSKERPERGKAPSDLSKHSKHKGKASKSEAENTTTGVSQNKKAKKKDAGGSTENKSTSNSGTISKLTRLPENYDGHEKVIKTNGIVFLGGPPPCINNNGPTSDKSFNTLLPASSFSNRKKSSNTCIAGEDSKEEMTSMTSATDSRGNYTNHRRLSNYEHESPGDLRSTGQAPHILAGSSSSSNVENDWTTNPIYAVSAIQTDSSSSTPPSPNKVEKQGTTADKCEKRRTSSSSTKPSKSTLKNCNDNVSYTNNYSDSKNQNRDDDIFDKFDSVHEQRMGKVVSSTAISDSNRSNLSGSSAHSAKPAVHFAPSSTPPRRCSSSSSGKHHHHQNGHRPVIRPTLKAEPVIRCSSVSPERDFLSDEDDFEEEENRNTKHYPFSRSSSGDMKTPMRRSSLSSYKSEDSANRKGSCSSQTVTSVGGDPFNTAPVSPNVNGNGEDSEEMMKVPCHTERKSLEHENVALSNVSELIHNMRILTEIQGLFYTGRLNALQPPDVYGVTLDNERGAAPHLIFSAEEVLERCIREARPVKMEVGLRICAYWSPQYSGLYPGKVSADYVPGDDPQNDLVPIEFDDGDTGVIKVNEIRLLAVDHPIREYDPNPLLTLEKKHRKRRHSSATGSQSGCTGDHEEPDCGEPYCAKAVGKLEDEDEEEGGGALKGGKLHGGSRMLYWTWNGLGYKRPRSKKDRNKEFFDGIQRGDEVIKVGDSALFISSGNDRPFIGRVEKFWEKKGQKVVKVRWYYHPDEVKTNKRLHGLYTGALFESPHIDENDVQTIAKKCDVIPFQEFKGKVGALTKWSRNTSQRSSYYITGYYDPYTYKLQLKDLK